MIPSDCKGMGYHEPEGDPLEFARVDLHYPCMKIEADLRARLAESEAREQHYLRRFFVIDNVEGDGCEHGYELCCLVCGVRLAMQKQVEAEAACGCIVQREHWPDCQLSDVATNAQAEILLGAYVRAAAQPATAEMPR